MKVSFQIGPNHLRKELVGPLSGKDRAEPGSLIVLDGNFVHATPPSKDGIRASLYCAWHDKDVLKLFDIPLSGNDNQWRLLDAINLLTQDLAKWTKTKNSRIESLKGEKVKFEQLCSKLVAVVLAFVSAETKFGKVDGIALPQYLTNNPQFLAMCQKQGAPKTAVKRASELSKDEKKTKKHSK